MKKKSLPLSLSHLPFKRAHKYDTIEDAYKDHPPGVKISKRRAETRMAEQSLRERVKKEKDY